MHLSSIHTQVYKTPFQRIVYRSYEGTGTYSSLELYPHSKLLQDIYQSITKLQTSFVVKCEVSILHVYVKSVQDSVIIGGGGATNYTTVSPNLLGLEGSKRGGGAGSGGGGDPDNSPLTGRAASLHRPTTTKAPPPIIIIISTSVWLIFFYVFCSCSCSSLWHFCNGIFENIWTNARLCELNELIE